MEYKIGVLAEQLINGFACDDEKYLDLRKYEIYFWSIREINCIFPRIQNILFCLLYKKIALLPQKLQKKIEITPNG